MRCIIINELYHYGVPGMKWGVRKAASKAASFYINHPLLSTMAISGGTSAITHVKNKKYKPTNKKRYERNKRLYGATKARKMDQYTAKYGGNSKEAFNSLAYGRKGAKRIENRIKKGDSRSKAEGKELARHMAKAFAVSAASFAISTPQFRKSAAKGMRYAGNAYKYMRHTRYNKAVQLRDPGFRYVKAKWSVNIVD